MFWDLEQALALQMAASDNEKLKWLALDTSWFDKSSHISCMVLRSCVTSGHMTVVYFGGRVG